MGRILSHWRIGIAGLLSLVLIVGALFLTRSIESPPIAEASAETALLQAIASKDSDGDGLFDWEEALYGANPRTTDSFNLGMTDGEAVAKGLVVPKAIADIPAVPSGSSELVDPSLPPPPSEGSLTSAFSQNFFLQYLSAKQANGGADLTEEEMANISNEALTALGTAVSTAADYKSARDLTVAGSGRDALVQFAVKVEEVSKKHSASATTSELTYLMRAVRNNDEYALTHIASKAKAYREGAVGIATLPVPQELASADLMLINAFMRLSEILNDFTRINDDPLATMLALKQYPDAVSALGTAFIRIATVYQTAGVVLPPGSQGATFVNLISEVAAEQGVSPMP